MEDSATISPPLAEGWIRIRVADGLVEFQGELVTDSSSDDKNLARWTELSLYRTTDGTQRYMLHVTGRSTIYHAVDGCNRGVNTSLAELADRYLDPSCVDPIPEPCEDCHPLDIEADGVEGVTVKMEVDWSSVHECRDVPDLIQKLRMTKGRSVGQFGMPALLLLDRAKRLDPTIAAALNQVRRL